MIFTTHAESQADLHRQTERHVMRKNNARVLDVIRLISELRDGPGVKRQLHSSRNISSTLDDLEYTANTDTYKHSQTHTLPSGNNENLTQFVCDCTESTDGHRPNGRVKHIEDGKYIDNTALSTTSCKHAINGEITLWFYQKWLPLFILVWRGYCGCTLCP